MSCTSFRFADIFSKWEAAASGDAADSRYSDPKEIITKLHANRGHGSAQQSDRALVDSNGGTMGLLSVANEAAQR